MRKWSHTAEMQLFSLGGFALPLLWKVAQILCQFLWTPSSKSSLYWKHSALGAWPDGPAWSLCTACPALGVCWSCGAGRQTSGGSSNPELSLHSLRTIRNAAPAPFPIKSKHHSWLHITSGSWGPTLEYYLSVVLKYQQGHGRCPLLL